jgi:toxin-antitoxin system PIN domain toxin
MSASLLDVNVLIALIDPAHVHFHAAHEWFTSRKGHTWATCPITVNGCIRILSQPGYAGRVLSCGEAASLLRERCRLSDHEFWPDDISLLDEARCGLSKVIGPRQITDIYLLALAVTHRGQLVTFDRTIPWRAVAGASQANLRILGG